MGTNKSSSWASSPKFYGHAAKPVLLKVFYGSYWSCSYIMANVCQFSAWVRMCVHLSDKGIGRS